MRRDEERLKGAQGRRSRAAEIKFEETETHISTARELPFGAEATCETSFLPFTDVAQSLTQGLTKGSTPSILVGVSIFSVGVDILFFARWVSWSSSNVKLDSVAVPVKVPVIVAGKTLRFLPALFRHQP
ncbi:hypothetical protein R3P38DRAFT_2799162 [Favolaschia claudopus]|uniref:Uncharacterized protein n=1 Tax=Favolaschia claudopus TaxID=2862362 RepID=A0AAW0A0M2_9AGAR